MASVPRSHRKAYGAHRPMSPAVKAANVARSIREHGLDIASVETWKRYGLETNVEQMTLVRQALRAMELEDYRQAQIADLQQALQAIEGLRAVLKVKQAVQAHTGAVATAAKAVLEAEVQ
jgi:hypothetical protein